jgi:diphthamide synthase (EF-2-diphthine--ammonia ligase)
MTTNSNEDFPFEEIRDDIVGGNGDLFDTVFAAMSAGFEVEQIWSITEEDDVQTHGPSHHWINLLGYVCTNERHDGETYYHYDMAQDREPEDQAELDKD